MLILTRRRHERIRIDKRIILHVLRITSSIVELGIEAPPWVAVDREEIYQRKRLNGRNGVKPFKPS